MNEQSGVVSARGLTKRYGDAVAVDGIDFDIAPGRCFGFLGPNGAGKTTSLRMTLGLTPISEGTLSVFGLPVGQCDREIRARVGIVPQADNLDPDFTVAENLAIYASYFGMAHDSPNGVMPRPIPSPVVCSVASPSPVHWSTTPSWWCSMSRPPASTRRRATSSGGDSPSCVIRARR